jgi:hypothetical protein
MAGVTSTLEADFSDYIAEIAKANAAMREMIRQAEATGTAFQDTAASMDAVGAKSNQSAGGVNSMSTALRTADKTLGAFGVQMGSKISALEEMEGLAGKTASQLGILGTAGAVAGAALAGWNIGRWIADITGADKAIADFAARIAGLGSVSKETAAYQAEIIEKAKLIDPTVRTAAQAVIVLEKAERARMETFNTGANRIKTWRNDIHDADTDIAGLREEIKLGASSVEQMSSHFHASTDAIKWFTKQVNEDTAARKAWRAEADAQAAAFAEISAAVKGNQAVLDTLTDSERAATEAALAAGVAQGVIVKAYSLTAVQVRAVADAMKDAEKAVKEFDAAQKIADDTNANWNNEIVQRSMTTTAQLQNDIEAWRTKTIEALDATGGATQEHYDKVEQIAGEKLSQVLLDWDKLRQGAIATYADQAARAEATYQEMLAHSTRYTTEAIANALKLRDETLASYEAMSGAHSAAYAEFLKRDQAYAASLKQFQTEAATGAQAKWDAEAAALDKAIAYSQAYGVTIDDAKKALGMMGDAGKAAGDKTKQGIDGAKESIVQMGGAITQTAAQMDALAAHYERMASDTMKGGGTGLGWSPFQMGQNYQDSAAKLRQQAGAARQYESAIAPQQWQRGNALTVTVNNADAQGIASKLVEEMRHSGVRFG